MSSHAAPVQPQNAIARPGRWTVDPTQSTAVRAMRRGITAANAMLIATPEYNASLSGQLKNALDWASRPSAQSGLGGKPVAVIGAGPSRFGAVWAQAEARTVLSAAGARVIASELALPHAPEQFDANDGLVDPQVADRLGQLLHELAGVVQASEEARAA